MSAYRALAPAKVNLGLFLGPTRPSDARHELVTVMQSISLADELTLECAPSGVSDDEVICPGVAAPAQQNLAAAALRAFRAATGWDAPPLRLRIRKRIPVAAGLAGGSADAAAALRLAVRASGLGDEELLRELGAELGADVPAQVRPGRWLATGAGERLDALPEASPSLGLLLLPLAVELSTAAVYAEADRLGLVRPQSALSDRCRALHAALQRGAPVPGERELLHNDLQEAAISLCPQIAQALAQAREAGAEQALVSGSGPTVVGLFPPPARSAIGGLELARSAAAGLSGRFPAPICATSVDAAFAEVASVTRPA
ncbi:MAG: 4-(cytidine 5'-diphospho)-2-C-methyl-D-erythritol kinase [Solirubrobacterales bacterium]